MVLTILKTRHLRWIAVLSLFTSLLISSIFGWLWFQAQHYNQAVINEDWQVAATHPSDHGALAKAYGQALQHSNDDFQATVHAFATVIATAKPQLQRIARYNLATLYLQRGLRLLAEQQSDTALPLLELAKELYRQRLRIEPDHWNSKYNLEQALRAAPDRAEQTAPPEQRNPGPSRRAAGTGRAKQPLP